MKLYSALLTSIFLSQLLFAQNQWIVFDSLNSPLYDNNILSLKHDKNNNIWIGTNYGLFKFDGYFWNLYNTANSGLPSNTVNILVIDTHNNLWFMVSPDNYPYFVKFNGVNWIKTDTNQSCLESCEIKEFAVDQNEVKWVSGQQVGGLGGIIRVSEDSCTRYGTEIASYNATDFIVDQNNHFWFSADWYTGYTGVAKYNYSQWLYHHLWSIGLAVDTVFNEAWFSSAWVIHKIDINDLTEIAWYEVPWPPSDVRKIFPDKNYNLWCRTTGYGIYKFDRTTDIFTRYNKSNSGIPSDTAKSIAIDDSNNVWIATRYGLAVFNETGIGLLQSVSSKDTLDFDTVAVNNTLSLSYTIHNPLSSDITINSIEINSSIFEAIETLPVTITPGSSKEFVVEFSPDSSTNYKSKMTINTNQGMKSILLTGYGNYPTLVNNNELNLISYQLFQNHPNPFNPNTKIKYQLPEFIKIKLTVFDVLGREVKTLVNEEKPAGAYEVNFDGTGLPSGVYFYRIESGSFSDTKKFVLLK